MSDERIDLSSFTGHTPGPWVPKWSKYVSNTFIVQAGMPSNRLLASFDGDGDGPDNQSLADARLIAAAPDLLAEIERLRAEVAEVKAEAVRIERENIEGWKQATHCRERLTAAESALAALRKRVEEAEVVEIQKMPGSAFGVLGKRVALVLLEE